MGFFKRAGGTGRKVSEKAIPEEGKILGRKTSEDAIPNEDELEHRLGEFAQQKLEQESGKDLSREPGESEANERNNFREYHAKRAQDRSSRTERIISRESKHYSGTPESLQHHTKQHADLQKVVTEVREDFERQKESGHYSEEELKEIEKTVLDAENSLGNLKKGVETEEKMVNASVEPGGSYAQSQQKKNTLDQEEVQDDKDRDEKLRRVAEEQKQAIYSKLESKIQRIRQKEESAIEKVKTGPHGLVKFYSGTTAIYISGVVDSAIGWIPFIGAIIGFIFNMVFWIVPCIAISELFSYGKILMFYILDGVLGLVWDVIDAGTLGLGMILDPIVDFLPELLGGKLLSGLYPPKLIAEAYEENKITKIHKISMKARDAEQEAHTDADRDAQSIDKRLRGELVGKKPRKGLKKIDLEPEARKLFSFLFAMLIMLIGPVGIFVPFLSFFTLSFSGAISAGQLVILAVIIISLFLVKTIGLIDHKGFVGLLVFLFLNIIFTYLLKGTAFLAQYIGSNAILGLIIFMAGSIIYVFHMTGFISNKGVIIISILIILILSSFYLSTYIGSSDFQANVAQGKVDAKVAAKNTNVIDMFKNWITGQRMKGSGNYIAGDVQRTHEFIGVQIADLHFYKEHFHADEPVRLDVDYEANANLPIQLLTVCKSGIHYAKTDHEFVEVSSSKNPRVSCTFDHLPKGQNLVEVMALYSFESTVDVPVKFIASSLEEPLTFQSKDSGNGLTPEKYVGGTEKAYTSPGPIVIGVSNEGRSDDLKMPIIVNKDNPSKYPTNLRFQINQQATSAHPEKIERIQKASINVPQGILMKSCDLGNKKTDLSYHQEGDRWVYDIVDGVGNWGAFTTISCDIGFDKAYIDKILPDMTLWSPQTILFTVDYNYQTTLATSIEVIS